MWSSASKHSQISRLQAELEQMRRQLAAFGEDMSEHASEVGREGAAHLRNTYDRAQIQARQRAGEATGAARKQVAAHPLSTVAGAFAVGIIFGAILGRR